MKRRRLKYEEFERIYQEYYLKSTTELGRQMNLSPGNVRMIQKRALEKLRMIMEKQGE